MSEGKLLVASFLLILAVAAAGYAIGGPLGAALGLTALFIIANSLP